MEKKDTLEEVLEKSNENISKMMIFGQENNMSVFDLVVSALIIVTQEEKERMVKENDSRPTFLFILSDKVDAASKLLIDLYKDNNKET